MHPACATLITMRIVIPDPIWGIPQNYWDELRTLGVDIYDDKPTDKAEAIARSIDAEAIVLNYVAGDREFIDAIPNLKHIISPAVGYDWIDVEYARSKGITVSNCPTFASLAVAEQALALILALARRIPEAQTDMRGGVWQSSKYVGMELSGRTLGLIGYGNIGRHIETMATALGMHVQCTNSKSTDDERDALLRSADILCLCLPLTAITHHLIGAEALSKLKPNALLINISRGAIIDQTALLTALKSNSIGGAGLDVFEGEPGAVGAMSAEIMELINLPNVVATPHTATNTPEARDRKGAEIVANIKACIAGEPINLVT